MVANPNPNSNPSSPIQSFHEFVIDFTKSLISRIYCNIYSDRSVDDSGENCAVAE